MSDTFTWPGVPTPFAWGMQPAATALSGGELTVTAGAGTDLFADPGGEPPTANAPYAATTPPDGDFTFSARVRPELVETFDAGCLLLLVDDDHWAKLACEQTPQGEPMVVSVVTSGHSDDANGQVLPQADVWLRIARIGGTFAFHASLDGTSWQFLRHFRLDPDARARIAVSAQSPVGQGCTARFSDVRLTAGGLKDLRDLS